METPKGLYLSYIFYSGTREALLSIVCFQNQICYPTPEGVYAFDGKNQPRLLIDQPATFINGLGDGMTVTDGKDTWVYDGSKLILLNTEIYDHEFGRPA